MTSDGDGTHLGPATPEAECEPALAAFGPDAELVAAFTSDGTYRVVCWIDAPVAKSPPPTLKGETRPSFGRSVVGVRADNGAIELIKAGSRDSLRVEAP